MQDEHRAIIKQNMSSLVERTSLKVILQPLIDKEVFTVAMADKYQNHSKTERELKRELFLDIQRRGPHAFTKLIDVLSETGYWELVSMLNPTHYLANQQPSYETKFISISKKKDEERKEKRKSEDSSEAKSSANSKVEPLKINVVKSTVFQESINSLIGCYYTKSKNRGITLLINNIEFENGIEDTRQGAMVDQENLKELFNQIGFSKFIDHNNLPLEKFKETLKNFTTMPSLKTVDCVFVVIASHGTNVKNKDHVKCSDGGEISVRSIIEYFNNKNCPNLLGKPKIFVFQICRGNERDYGYGYEMKTEGNDKQAGRTSRTQLDGKSTSATLSTYTDMLIVHSTLPGFASHRDKIIGSWYIRSMCEIFMKHAHNTHVEDLFKLVDENLKNIRNYDQANKSIQNSSVENQSFTKHCYLNPGLFKNEDEM